MVDILLSHTHVVCFSLLPSIPWRPWHHPGHRYYVLSCDQPAGEGPRPGGLLFLVRSIRQIHFVYHAHSCIVGPASRESPRRFLVAVERSTRPLLPASPRGMHAVMLASIHTLLGSSQRPQWPHAVRHPQRLILPDGLLEPQRPRLPAQLPPRHPPAPNTNLLCP